MEKELTSLMEKFITLGRMMMYSHHHTKGHCMHSPYRGQGRILSLLKLEPKMSQKKLAFLLGIRPQSMGELLAKLEQSGDIVRMPSEEDKRALDIELTEKGMSEAVKNEDASAFDQNHEDVFSCLTADEQDHMNNYMDKLIEELKSKMPEDHQALFQKHMHMMHHHMHDDHHHDEHAGFAEHFMKKCMHHHHGEHGHRDMDENGHAHQSPGDDKLCPICKNHCDLETPKCNRGTEYKNNRS
jgi:DNA-binding MarR family transcriptional regulator